MYYLYRHIRLDKNEPFYIGISKSKNFKRAYSKNNRNKLWHLIINKTGFEVNIILDNLDKTQVYAKEKEFIALYGRKDLKNGILVNMTDGGEGNMNPNNECRDKISKIHKGVKKSQKHIEAIKISLNQPETRQKRIDSIIKNHNSREYKEKMSIIMKGRKKSKKHIKKVIESKQCPINQLDINGNFIKRWDSIKIVQDILNIYNVSLCCRGKIKQTKGFRFEYAQKNKSMKHLVT